MKTLGNKIKEQFGLPAENKVKELTPEDKQRVKKYFEEIRKPIEKKFPDVPKAELLREVIIRKVKDSLSVTGKEFKMYPQTRFLIDLSALYFSNDERFHKVEAVNSNSLNKGLLIIGACGVGKSLILQAATSTLFDGNIFAQRSCNQVVKDFDEEGGKGLKKYLRGEWYFDDLGTENEGKHYGKAEDVFTTILSDRYELFTREGKRTVLSTNFTPEEIGKRYGKRIESRLYEMFNIIVIGGKDIRQATTKKPWKK